MSNCLSKGFQNFFLTEFHWLWLLTQYLLDRREKKNNKQVFRYNKILRQRLKVDPHLCQCFHNPTTSELPKSSIL